MSGEEASMTSPPTAPETNHDVGASGGRSSSGGTPRWVKLLGVIVIALILLFGILQFVGGGGHGPGRHAPDSNPASHTPPIEHAP